MGATIAHQINNPLESVVNLLCLLRSQVIDEEGTPRYSRDQNQHQLE
jgi:hypothetical protein